MPLLVDGSQRERRRLGQDLPVDGAGLVEQADEALDGVSGAHPIARLLKLRVPSTQKIVVMTTSAASTTPMGMCGELGVSDPRSPSATYTIGLIRTAYFITGTTDSPAHG